MSRTLRISIAVVVLALSGAAWASPKPALTAMAAGDVKWQPDPDNPSMMMSVISGDPQTGPWEGLAKFKAGLNMPLHHHTADITAVVIQGAMVLTFEGKGPKEFPAGSYVVIPGGMKHATSCKAGADCMIYERNSAKADMIPEAPAGR